MSQLPFDVDVNTNDNGSLSANNDVDLPKDDFIFVSKNKYCTRRKKYTTIVKK